MANYYLVIDRVEKKAWVFKGLPKLCKFFKLDKRAYDRRFTGDITIVTRGKWMIIKSENKP